MGTTPRGIPYPDPTAYVADGADAMRLLAQAVDAELVEEAAARAALDTAVDTRLDDVELYRVDRRLVDAAGDLLVGSGADTLARLARGTAGQLLASTAEGLVWAAPPSSGVTVSKTTDTARVSTNVPAADPALTVPVVSGKRYLFDLVALTSSGAFSAPNLLLRVDAPAAAGSRFAGVFEMATNPQPALSLALQLGTNYNVPGLAIGNNGNAFRASGVFTATANGSLVLSWSADAVNSTAVTIHAGSYLTAREV